MRNKVLRLFELSSKFGYRARYIPHLKEGKVSTLLTLESNWEPNSTLNVSEVGEVN